MFSHAAAIQGAPIDALPLQLCFWGQGSCGGDEHGGCVWAAERGGTQGAVGSRQGPGAKYDNDSLHTLVCLMTVAAQLAEQRLPAVCPEAVQVVEQHPDMPGADVAAMYSALLGFSGTGGRQ